jgi:hypothetical protein
MTDQATEVCVSCGGPAGEGASAYVGDGPILVIGGGTTMSAGGWIC